MYLFAVKESFEAHISWYCLDKAHSAQNVSSRFYIQEDSDKSIFKYTVQSTEKKLPVLCTASTENVFSAPPPVQYISWVDAVVVMTTHIRQHCESLFLSVDTAITVKWVHKSKESVTHSSIDSLLKLKTTSFLVSRGQKCNLWQHH
jgi:hypothetical protein